MYIGLFFISNITTEYDNNFIQRIINISTNINLFIDNYVERYFHIEFYFIE